MKQNNKEKLKKTRYNQCRRKQDKNKSGQNNTNIGKKHKTEEDKI